MTWEEILCGLVALRISPHKRAMTVNDTIQSLIDENPVVLFMKGSRGAPQCGFSARVVAVLDDYLDDYRTVDVLSAPEIRAGIKTFSDWPTIPQLYVKGEFIGGCDIVTDMGKNGELEQVLGTGPLELTMPEVFITSAALAKLTEFAEGDPIVVRLEVTSAWQYGLDFDSPRASDVVVKGPGWTIVMERGAARKSDGLSIDFVEGPQGAGFKINNPNEPARVEGISATTVKAWLDGNKPFELFDVRSDEERAIASLDGARALGPDPDAALENLDRSTPLVFMCHHGRRSLAAANHAIQLGFQEVYNFQGGIDAWSTEVDPSTPRY